MPDRSNVHRSGSFRRLLVVGVSTWAILAAAGASAAPIIDTVALSGQEISPGTTFRDFDLFSMNNNGAVAFSARTLGATSGTGIWSGTLGNLGLVARQGDIAPGTSSGETFSFSGSSLGAPLISDSNEVVFRANLGNVPSGAGRGGIWAGTAGNVELVARERETAPGSTGLRSIRYLGFNNLAQSDNGQLSYGAPVLISGLGGAIRSNGTGIWSGPSSGPELVAEDAVATAKSDAPGAPSTVNFLQITPAPTVNNQGQTAFTATLEDPFDRTVNENNDRGLWFGNATSARLVAREGDTAGTGFVFQDFNGAEVNNLGQVAFKASLRPDGGSGQQPDSIWLDSGSGPTLVARQGDVAPDVGPNVVFASFINHTLGDNGQIATRANISGIGVNTTNNVGVWVGDETGLQLVARSGATAPGTDRTFVNFAKPLINANGDMLLLAALSGQSAVGIFMDLGNGLEKILATDDILEVALGDERTVSEFRFSPDAFNNLAQALINVIFTDGTEGLFRVGLDGAPEPEPEPVPEPASILILSSGLFAMAFITRRRKPRGL